jgi:hypothetical protein
MGVCPSPHPVVALETVVGIAERWNSIVKEFVVVVVVVVRIEIVHFERLHV